MSAYTIHVLCRLELELKDARNHIEKLEGDKTKVSVSQQMELQKLKDSEQQLQVSLQESKRHIERYDPEKRHIVMCKIHVSHIYA